jgi:hypothetical protein
MLKNVMTFQNCNTQYHIYFSWLLVVVIGFPLGATLNATEGVTTTVNVCPQLLEGTLERDVSVFATTLDMSARGGYRKGLSQKQSWYS